MKTLQRNLNSSTLVVWEMKRNVSVVRFKFRCNTSHVPALWHVKEPSTSLNYECASKIPCIVPSFASRRLSCLCGAWRLWRWMRRTHWGQGYNRPTGCSAEKATHATFNFFFVAIWSLVVKIIKEMPGSVASGTPFITVWCIFVFILRPDIRTELNVIRSSLPYEYVTIRRNSLYIATIEDWTTRHSRRDYRLILTANISSTQVTRQRQTVIVSLSYSYNKTN